tara:strand:- start:957 stop:1631 length:675 start_codon:yes stop_codon:yes gene_type:complete
MTEIGKPLVSVIIPVFNAEKQLARCLRSILNQSFSKKKYEIIVVDDASEDNSKLIWSSLSHESNEIVCIENEKNMGLPYCLNKGIEKAQGHFFLRLDSDDYVNEFYVEALYNFLVMNEHYDAVACDYIEVDDSENFLIRRDCFKKPLGCGIIFNKKHWLEIGKYDEDFKLHEEIDFIIRFKSKYSLGRLEMPLYRYRKHSDNITNDLENVNKYNKKLKEKHKNL